MRKNLVHILRGEFSISCSVCREGNFGSAHRESCLRLPSRHGHVRVVRVERPMETPLLGRKI